MEANTGGSQFFVSDRPTPMAPEPSFYFQQECPKDYGDKIEGIKQEVRTDFADKRWKECCPPWAGENRHGESLRASVFMFARIYMVARADWSLLSTNLDAGCYIPSKI